MTVKLLTLAVSAAALVWSGLASAQSVIVQPGLVEIETSLRLPGTKPTSSAAAPTFGEEGSAVVAAIAAPKPKRKPASGGAKTYGGGSLISPWVITTSKFVATADEVGRPGDMLCVLTFDDGPHKVYDPQILDILRRENVVATFYLLGRSVKAFPKTTQMIIDAGHEIAAHSWDHKDQSKLSESAVLADMQRANSAFAAHGIRPAIYRPPYGAQNSKVRNAARALDMEIVRWTVDTLDWKSSSTTASMLKTLDRDLGPGGVVLLHSINERAVKALPSIIRSMREKGCKFVTQGDWLAQVKK